MKLRRGSLVIVDWLDTHTDAGWQAPDELDVKPAPVRSVGFVVAATAEALVLAGDGAPKNPHKDEVNRRITIPAGMVKCVRSVCISKCEVVK